MTIRRATFPPGVAVLLALALGMAPTPAPATPRAGPIRGVALAEIHPGHGLLPFTTALDRIRELGAEWVMLPVYGYVDSTGAAAVDTDWEPPITMDDYRGFVKSLIAECRRRGLLVCLIPYLNLREGDAHDWRGNLHPPNWDVWFNSYRQFLDGWVRLARDERLPMLAVGAELVSAESEVDAWRRLIASVRADFRGTLIYSCNWDHYREVMFLDALDMVGLSAYYSLPYDAPLTEANLESLWREVKNDVLHFSREIDRPVLFTEIGYPSVREAVRDPWNYLMEGPADVEWQARGLSAFSRVWRGDPGLAGVFFWNWSPFRAGPDDCSYSIAGKPAEGVVRYWFLGSYSKASSESGARVARRR